MRRTQNTHAWSPAGEEAVYGRRSRKMNAANTEHTHVVSGWRRGGGVLADARKGSGPAAVIRESVESAACSLAREGRRRQSLALGPGEREKSETVVKQMQLPSAGLDSMRRARAQKTT